MLEPSIAAEERIDRSLDGLCRELAATEVSLLEVKDRSLVHARTSPQRRTETPSVPVAGLLASLGSQGTVASDARVHPFWRRAGLALDIAVPGVDGVLGVLSALKTPSGPDGVVAPWSANDRETLSETGLRLAPFLERRRQLELRDDPQRNLESLLAMQRQAELGRLALAAIHDMNNLLTSVQGAMQFLRSRAVAENDPDGTTTKVYESGLESLRHFERLIGEVVAFHRAERSTPLAFAIDEHLRRTASLLRSQLGPNIHLDLDLDADSSRILARPIQLTQVLVNLGSNARDALAGSGRVFIRTRVVESDTQSWVELVFEDDGPGIPEGVMDRLFEPFFTTKGPGEGSGLGLATVLEAVTALSGRIRAGSRDGGGASFRILLPEL